MSYTDETAYDKSVATKRRCPACNGHGSASCIACLPVVELTPYGFTQCVCGSEDYTEIMQQFGCESCGLTMEQIEREW